MSYNFHNNRHPLFEAFLTNPSVNDRFAESRDTLGRAHDFANFSTSAIVSTVGKSHGNHEHGCCGMSMYFHVGIKEPYVLFKNWQIDTIGGLIGSMVAIFFIAVLYEGLKVFRQCLVRRNLHMSKTVTFGTVPGQSSTSCSDLSKEPTFTEAKPQPYITKTFFGSLFTVTTVHHLTQSGLHMVQLVVSYLLMLIAMTYNVWLCLALILGAGVGYFVFGLFEKQTTENNNEHCH